MMKKVTVEDCISWVVVRGRLDFTLSSRHTVLTDSAATIFLQCSNNKKDDISAGHEVMLGVL